MLKNKMDGANNQPSRRKDLAIKSGRIQRQTLVIRLQLDPCLELTRSTTMNELTEHDFINCQEVYFNQVTNLYLFWF